MEEDFESGAIPTAREKFISGLRDLALFLETHPEVPSPTSARADVIGQKDIVLAAARATSWSKNYGADFFWLSKDFGGGVRLDVTTYRDQVCRKVVKGTKVVPAVAEHEVEEVEWVCDEALLSDSGPRAEA